jgi:hypothetical protein
MLSNIQCIYIPNTLKPNLHVKLTCLQVELKVLHAPVVDPPLTDYVQARAGEEVEVTCVVHAYPPPTVAWYRNGGLLAAQETVTAVRGERYTLIATPIGICSLLQSYDILSKICF